MELTNQKRLSEIEESRRRGSEFSENLLKHIMGLQKVYRTELDQGELHIWLSALKEIPLPEIAAATESLITHPPKYELDGEVQVWRGMPKLPDVIQKIVELREYKNSMLRANPPKFPECKDCDSTGWLVVQQESKTRPGNMVEKSIRCVCRKNFVLTAEVPE